MTAKPPRAWTYPRGEWTAWWPSTGGDEWHRSTIVLPVPFGPAVVIALPWKYACECGSTGYCGGEPADA